MSQHHHSGINVGPALLLVIEYVNRRQGPAELLLTVVLETDAAPADHLDEAKSGGIAPMLAILRAVDGVQPQRQSLQVHSDDHRVTVDDSVHFGDVHARAALERRADTRRTFSATVPGEYDDARDCSCDHKQDEEPFHKADVGRYALVVAM